MNEPSWRKHTNPPPQPTTMLPTSRRFTQLLQRTAPSASSGPVRALSPSPRKLTDSAYALKDFVHYLKQGAVSKEGGAPIPGEAIGYALAGYAQTAADFADAGRGLAESAALLPKQSAALRIMAGGKGIDYHTARGLAHGVLGAGISLAQKTALLEVLIDSAGGPDMRWPAASAFVDTIVNEKEGAASHAERIAFFKTLLKAWEKQDSPSERLSSVLPLIRLHHGVSPLAKALVEEASRALGGKAAT